MSISKRQVGRWALEAVVMLLLLWAVSAFQSRGLKRGSPPALALRSLDGAPVSLASYRGKPTLLVFWAPWCGVCKAVSPNVSRVARMVEGRAHVLSVATSCDDVANVRRYMAEQHIDYPVLLAGAGDTRAFGVGAFPSLFFLDERGVIQNALVGYTTTLGMYLRL
jgi:thiol-disulfide isomerase/thioredoxin